ncbi:hypothetical protein [Methylobacterium nigriterrae]|uniref:hypothetical protein n=1 Tax=Methylobacterium nigriterrae TaxID=3127512 RepID=UPI00301367CC
MRFFRAGRPKPEAVSRARVEAWAREAGALAEGTIVKASELLCPDPACPGYETVILVMEPGRPSRACKVVKPLDAVTREDVAAAFRAT